MPLSEHEQRMLAQIEQALYEEDPKFANTVRQTNPKVHYKRSIIKASVGFALGVCLLMGGVIVQQVFVGALGFLVMLGCALWGISGYRRVAGGSAEGEKAEAAEPKQRQKQRPGMMNRFEERWRRRQEGNDQ